MFNPLCSRVHASGGKGLGCYSSREVAEENPGQVPCDAMPCHAMQCVIKSLVCFCVRTCEQESCFDEVVISVCFTFTNVTTYGARIIELREVKIVWMSSYMYSSKHYSINARSHLLPICTSSSTRRCNQPMSCFERS